MICNMPYICFKSIITFLDNIKPLILFYSGWTVIHYICSQLYVYHCTPKTWYGILVSPLLSITPQCNAFRWIIYEAGNVLYGMWMAIASWTVANLLTHKV
jgi:hypothetical protein